MREKLSANNTSDYLPDLHENDPISSFCLDEVKYEEVSKLISSLSQSKSCGVDGLTARLIKSYGEAIVAALTHISNLSIETGILPEIWKMARVTPQYKSRPKNDATNYRSISVLPILGKILERLVHDRLYTHVLNANSLHDRQLGFRKRHSTGTCLIEFFLCFL